MRDLYVIDTNCLVAFYNDVFKNNDDYNASVNISQKASHIIDQAIRNKETNIRLAIPSVVFIEIYEKWLKEEEFAKMFYYDVYNVLIQSDNIEIKPIDREVLENLINIDMNLENHDLHDKIILASAMALNAPLITADTEIIKYVDYRRPIPGTLQ